MTYGKPQYHSKGSWEGEWYECPRCGADDIIRPFAFCPGCGMELDWSDVE